MSAEPGHVDPIDVVADVVLAVELLALDPSRFGGVVLRAHPGAVRDAICAGLAALLPPETPVLRVPLHVTEERLLGGLSLADTLRAGRVQIERGLLQRADGGVVVLPMAERLEPSVTSSICAALDRGELALERDGIAATFPCRIGVVALDEGLDDERAPEALRDRLSFSLNLAVLDPRTDLSAAFDPERIAAARSRLPDVSIGDDIVRALSQAALALGVSSVRGVLLAALVARGHAALRGSLQVEEEDAVAAARLVLGPRATRIPTPAAEEPEAADANTEQNDADEDKAEPPPPPQAENAESDDARDQSAPPEGALDEVVLAAAKSAIPQGLLDILTGREPRVQPRGNGRSGDPRASMKGGRPAGTRAAAPRDGEKLSVVDTLRAAAPWQRIRQRDAERARPLAAAARRVEVRKEDFRVVRFKQRTETSVIFAVDASGSAALQRLAEAKGAVEQVLADCYVRRDFVALLAFRGTTATLLLPPTRSLARVRRSLAQLAGGGTTPLSEGIDAALALAVDARKRQRTPILVFMTDGRANVAKNGGDRKAAAADAMTSARAVRASDVRALFLDTSPRPGAQARLVASEMGARYLPLPHLDAAAISREVQAIAKVSS